MGKLPITNTAKSHGNRSSGGDFFVPIPAQLYLADSTIFEGKAPAWQQGSFSGEVVFNTGMSGYIESLTDPSYSGEILVFTYPLIGNYGVIPEAGESSKIQASGVIVSEAAMHYSHSKATSSFLTWLHAQDIPILMDVDTRALTKHLRVRGTMLGAISDTPVDADKLTLEPTFISVDKPVVHNPAGKQHVILVDCGAKANILRSLLAMDLKVTQVPHDYDYSNNTYDGILLSNGPGDPTDYKATIANAKKALTLDKPIFGICLGSQIMGLASGAKTYKLPFGHRGHNQPCMSTTDQHCVITSQNHGYAVDETTLPKGWQVLYRNLNDNSVEGIMHTTKPFFAVQFHPEACPGPTDTANLFEKFRKLL